jgi:hypothetical protein
MSDNSTAATGNLLTVVHGFGTCLASTAAIAQVKKHRKGLVHVLTPYDDILQGLEFVDRYYPHCPLPYFWEDHQGFEIWSQTPYFRLAFRRGQEHIVDAWCQTWGVPAVTDRRGIIRLFQGEIDQATQYLAEIKAKNKGKPIVVFQPFGGTSLKDPNRALNLMAPRQIRDLPMDIAQEIATSLIKRDCIVLQLSLPTERELDGTFKIILRNQNNQPVVTPIRLWFAILAQCDYFLGIDSFGQHAWAALSRLPGRDDKQKHKSVVLWGATNPNSFSYQIHKDLTVSAKCETPHCMRPFVAVPDTVGEDSQWRCPYGEKCMKFKPSDVVDALLGPAEEEGKPGKKKGKRDEKPADPDPAPAPAAEPEATP